MPKVCFVQWLEDAAQVLHVVVVVVAIAVAELPLMIVCFAIPIWLELASVVANGLWNCLVVATGHQQ